jgi:hypothetical protein
MPDPNIEIRKRTEMDDVNELAISAWYVREPQLDNSGLDRAEASLNVLHEVIRFTREYRAERTEVETRYMNNIGALANTSFISMIEINDGQTEIEEPIDLDTDQDKDDLDDSIVGVPTMDVVEDAEFSDEKSIDVKSNPEEETTDEITADEIEVNSTQTTKTQDTMTDSRSVNWGLVNSCIIDICRGKAKGTELSQSDFLAHPYFAEMIEKAGGKKGGAKSQATTAVHNARDLGILKHNGKIKSASRWILVTDELPEAEPFLAQ